MKGIAKILIIGLIFVILTALYIIKTVPPVSVQAMEICTHIGRLKEKCARAFVRIQLKKHTAGEILPLYHEQFGNYQCHVFGHIIGQELYCSLNSPEDALGSCSTICNGACPHGVFGEIFASVPEVRASLEELRHPSIRLLKDEGRRICASRHGCHAVGHVLFALYNDLPKALDFCAELADVFAPDCRRGIFMESFTGILSETGASNGTEIYRRANDMLYPCDSELVAREYKPSCYYLLVMNQVELLKEQGITNEYEIVERRVSACQNAPDTEQRDACFQGIGWSLHDLISEPQELCLKQERPAAISCLFGLGAGYADFGAFSALIPACENIEDDELQRACFAGIFDTLTVNRSMRPNICEGYSSCLQILEEFHKDPQIPVTR